MTHQRQRHLVVSTVLATVLLSTPLLQAQSIVRGPYLQDETSTGIVVRWRTDRPTAGRVDLGATTDTLAAAALLPSPTTEHIVPLANLSPDTRYYYSVGTTTATLAGGDAGHFFITAPTPGTEKLTRVWVVGDSGMNAEGAWGVRDAYARFTGDRPTDVFLQLGDNAYWNGTDADFQVNYFELYPAMLAHACAWPTFGNHDAYGGSHSAIQSGPYYDNFTLPTRGEGGGVPSGTEAYYSFDYGNIHFVCLDSYDSDRTTSGPMLTWLREDLAANARRWTIAFWHYPPYTKGSYDSDLYSETRMREMRENALPICEAGGVDLVLCGHSHVYERSYLLNGHYGVSTTLTPAMILDAGDGNPDGDGPYRKPARSPVPNAGAVYVVCGVASILRTGPMNHPAMKVSMSRFGSMVVDVDGDRMEVRFLGDTEETLNRFVILKEDLRPAGWVLY